MMATTHQKKVSLVSTDLKKMRRALDESQAQSLEEVKDKIAGGEFFDVEKLIKSSQYEAEDLLHLFKYALSCNMETIAILLLLTLRKVAAVTDEELQYLAKVESSSPNSELFCTVIDGWRMNDTSLLNRVKRDIKKLEIGLLESPIYKVFDEASKQINLNTSDVLDKDFNTLLHAATVSQQPAMIHAYGLLGVQPSAQNKDGDTALHVAARIGNIEVVETLLMVGVNTTLKNKMGLTAADIALQQNQATITETINRNSPGLVQGIINGSLRDVTRAVKRWSSPLAVPLHLASSLSEESPIFRAVRAAADNIVLAHRILANDTRSARRMLNQPTFGTPRLNLNLKHPDSGMTLLAAAVRNANHLLVSDLLLHGAKSRIRIHREPLVVLAVRWNCPVNIITLLLQNDSLNWTERDNKGRTAFLAAVEDGRSVEDIVTLVRLSHGLCLAQRNMQRQTALDFCRDNGKTGMLEALQLEVQSLFTHVTKENKVVLMQLAVSSFGRENFTLPMSPGRAYDKFIEHLGDIENRGLALMIAAASGDLEEVKRLNDAAFIDQNGYTALTRAILHDRYNVVLWLISERPILKDIADLEGRTALHYAYALPDHIGGKYVKLLLEQDPELLETRPDKNDVLPHIYANLRGTTKIETMLKNVLFTDVTGKSGLLQREATMINF